jgi:hypothetical protein
VSINFILKRLIVAFSIQRFIVVYFPFKRYDFCDKSKTIKIIIIIIVFSLIFYSYTLFTSGLDEHNTCVTLDDWFLQVKVLVLVDIVQTMIVPFIIISIINALIMFKLMNSFKFNTRSNNRFKGSNIKNRSLQTFEVSEIEIYNSTLNEQTKQILKRQSYSINNTRHNKPSTNKETTKTLVIIASTFLILNFPIAGTKTFYFFKSSSTSTEFIGAELLFQENKNIETNFSYMNDLLNWSFASLSLSSENITNLIEISTDKLSNSNDSFINKTSFIEALNNQVIFNQKKELLERIASLIYYINFSINFFLYTFKTKKFREIFFHLFKHSK